MAKGVAWFWQTAHYDDANIWKQKSSSFWSGSWYWCLLWWNGDNADKNHDGDDNGCERVFRTKRFFLFIFIILIEMQFDVDIIWNNNDIMGCWYSSLSELRELLSIALRELFNPEWLRTKSWWFLAMYYLISQNMYWYSVKQVHTANRTSKFSQS